jgi:MinD superfamily P-loop ATPase
VTGRIDTFAAKNGFEIVGQIPYDASVTRAQIARKSIVEHSEGLAGDRIREMWDLIRMKLEERA